MEFKWKVGDKFNIKQGTKDWPKCEYGEEGTLEEGSSVEICEDLPGDEDSVRVLVRDSLRGVLRRFFHIDLKAFDIYVANGLFIPVGSEAMPVESKKAEPGMLNNRRNTGRCPCCSTQTVSFGVFSGFPSRDFICPKCKM